MTTMMQGVEHPRFNSRWRSPLDKSSGHRSTARPASHLGRVSTTDVEFLVKSLEPDLPGAGGIFLDPFNCAGGHEGVAMDAQVPVAKFLFQVYQRILYQVFLGLCAHHDIFAVGQEIKNLGN